MHTMIARLVLSLTLGLVTFFTAFADRAAAQSPFSPAIIINDEVVTRYELDQRARILTLLRATGDPLDEARESLIEDRLKQVLLREAELTVPPEDLRLAIEDMAANAQLTADEFIIALADNGVDYETLRDLLETNLAWSEYARARFLARARPSEEEIDRALGQGGRGSIQVSLAEIVIPVTPQNAAQVDVVVAEIAELQSFDAFSEAAAFYSQAPTAANGGRTGWVSISALPPLLRGPILALDTGDITQPIVLGNAVGLFQMRGIREVSGGAQSYSEIDYALVTMNPSAMRQSPQDVMAGAQRCDDLYGAALDNPAISVRREAQAPGAIPRDIALALARLDPEETALLPGTVQSSLLTSDGGATQVSLVRAVMLCSRTATVNDDASREDVARALAGQRLNALANQFLQERRADSVIVFR